MYKNTSIFTVYVTIYWPGTVLTEGLGSSLVKFMFFLVLRSKIFKNDPKKKRFSYFVSE